MKKLVLAAALLLIATAANAQTVDMADLKCSDTADFTAEQATAIMFWLHGYYGGQAGDTTVNFDALGDVAKQVGETCAANPDATVMDALKSVVGE